MIATSRLVPYADRVDGETDPWRQWCQDFRLSPGCADLPGWSDIDGFDCAVYESEAWCERGHVGSGWDPRRGEFAEYADGNSVAADTACCACYAPVAVEFWLIQDVEGSTLPRGLVACECFLREFQVTGSGFTGHFPLNLSRCETSSVMMSERGLKLADNSFSGPIPELPPQTTATYLQSNRWEGDLPVSWHKLTELTVLDFTGCGMLGPLLTITPYTEVVLLSGNRFHGPVPDSWKLATRLREIDLTGNRISGPLFTWGWPLPDNGGWLGPKTRYEFHCGLVLVRTSLSRARSTRT